MEPDQMTPEASPAAEGNYTLQLLHASDLEGGVTTPEEAPRFSQVVNALESEYPEQTLLISSGDNYIPGPFLAAGADPSLEEVLGSPGPGRGDILLMNEIGFDASALGNHEFDQGPGLVADLIGSDEAYPGTAFPYLSANLGFANSELADFVVADGQAPQPNSIAKSVVFEVNGQQVGVVGATTPDLPSLSSPGEVTVLPPDPEDIAALAAEIQPVVDQLLAQGVNKVILTSHLQQLANEQELAGLLEGVDIIIAGGSDTRLADETDRLRTGDEAEGAYPILTESASGEPIAIVSTDGNYSYLGRLVAEFDGQGLLLPESVDPAVSGAFATDEQGVTETGNFDLDPEVAAIATAIGDVIAEKDGNTFGQTAVFLNGERQDVRTQETNLGNLSADANLEVAQAADPSVVVSLKNGGGIRAAIGATDPETGAPLPPGANEAAGKSAGEVSQLDIENSLRFNNELTLLTLTAAQLAQVVEHGVAESEPGATPGQFPQVSGLAFSYDPDLPAGDRVESLAIQHPEQNAQEVIIEDGEMVGDPNRTFRVVTLNFLAGGGDDYPFAEFEAANPDQVNRVDLPTLDLAAGTATFADAGSEQDALAEYLTANFTSEPFSNEDAPPEGDVRIQNLNFTEDTVLNLSPMPTAPDGSDGQQSFAITPDVGETLISNFGGVGTGTNPSEDTLAEVDTLQFTGLGLSRENLLLTQAEKDLVVSFEGTDEPKVRLQDFQLENLENLPQGIGNILFEGQSEIQDSFDVFDADQQRPQVFNPNTTTFLNDLDNTTQGFNDSNDVINGQGGDDTLDGLSGDDILRGQEGNDTLDGGLGSDYLSGGPGDDQLMADMEDQLFGDEGNDFLDASMGSGSNELLGGAGKDELLAGSNDFLFGGADDDLLDASIGTGENRLFGGEGDDTLYAGIQDQLSGGTGDDSLDASYGAGGNELSGGEGNDELYAFSIDSLSGDEGDDTLDASLGIGGNILSGGEGNDSLYAGLSDQLFGDAGDDLLYAGVGGNTLTGGEDADQFWIADQGFPAAVNTITDFELGTDMIGIAGLSGVSEFGNLSLSQQGEDTLIRGFDTSLATLTGIEATALDSSSFTFA